jgi:hypothetical protein
VLRGGARSLDSELVLRACGLTRERWGFDGISAFEVPNGDLLALSRRLRAVAERPVIRTAKAGELRRRGFPLFDTGGDLHWTIVFADTQEATLDRLRACFTEPVSNPGYKLRPNR